MYTRGSAWLSFSEHERGMIRPGLLADWVALSEDPLAVEPMALRGIRVIATGVDGELVYQGCG
jgi:predicted amidohydrolase YtcJ